MVIWLTIAMEKKSELTQYIDDLNESNTNVKFYPRMVNGTLLSIDVRFFTPRNKPINREIKQGVSDKIERLSRGRIFLAEDDLFDHGIMDLKVSCIHKHCNISDYKRVLNYVSNEMMGELRPH